MKTSELFFVKILNYKASIHTLLCLWKDFQQVKQEGRKPRSLSILDSKVIC